MINEEVVEVEKIRNRIEDLKKDLESFIKEANARIERYNGAIFALEELIKEVGGEKDG